MLDQRTHFSLVKLAVSASACGDAHVERSRLSHECFLGVFGWAGLSGDQITCTSARTEMRLWRRGDAGQLACG